MTKSELKDFSLRIAGSSKTGLVVITYDIIVNYIESSKVSLENGDLEGYRFNLKKSKQFIDDLASNLDMRFEISYNLMQLYMYANECILKAGIEKNTEKLDIIIEMMSRLKDSFEEVAKSDVSGRMMNSNEQVYAGFTYGPNSQLDEITLR